MGRRQWRAGMMGDGRAPSIVLDCEVQGRWYMAWAVSSAAAGASKCNVGGCRELGRGLFHFKVAKTRAEGDLIPQMQPYYHLVANWQNFSLVASPVMVQWPSSHFLFTLLPAQTAWERPGMCLGERWMGLVITYPHNAALREHNSYMWAFNPNVA